MFYICYILQLLRSSFETLYISQSISFIPVCILGLIADVILLLLLLLL